MHTKLLKVFVLVYESYNNFLGYRRNSSYFTEGIRKTYKHKEAQLGL